MTNELAGRLLRHLAKESAAIGKAAIALCQIGESLPLTDDHIDEVKEAFAHFKAAEWELTDVLKQLAEQYESNE